MELADYPKAIAQAAKQYLILDQQMRQVKGEINRLKLEVYG